MASTLSSLDALLGTPPAPPKKTVSEERKPQPPPAPKQPQLPWGSASTQGEAKKAPARKGSFSFDEIMAFEGLAPEVINGLLGFIIAISGELSNGLSVYSQMVSGGFIQAVVISLAVSLASFAPAVRQVPWDKVFGKDKTPQAFGPFTAQAELSNGRAAMLGLTALILLEGAGSTAFFL